MRVVDSVLKLCRDDRQQKAFVWAREVFGLGPSTSREERIDRFVEEAVELAQSVDMSKERLLRIVEYVYDRPKGVAFQEIGGVCLTLMLLCHSHGFSTEEAEREEFDRVLSLDRERLREKHDAKAASGIARRSE